MFTSSANYSYLCCCILLFNRIALVSSQSEVSTVTADQCVGSPCSYQGECRDKFGECGDTVWHCDAESQWVPSCGGGGDLVKPTVVETATTMVPIALSQSEPPTLSPITAFQEWTNQNNDQSNTDQGVPDETLLPQGTPDWFDPNEWDNGQNATKDEDQSILDQISDTVFGDDQDSGVATQGASSLLQVLAVGALAAQYGG